jgi:hypothetical protein
MQVAEVFVIDRALQQMIIDNVPSNKILLIPLKKSPVVLFFYDLSFFSPYFYY